METVVGVALVFAGLAMLGMGLPPLHCSPIFCMQVAYLHICPLGISGGIDYLLMLKNVICVTR